MRLMLEYACRRVIVKVRLRSDGMNIEYVQDSCHVKKRSIWFIAETFDALYRTRYLENRRTYKYSITQWALIRPPMPKSKTPFPPNCLRELFYCIVQLGSL